MIRPTEVQKWSRCPMKWYLEDIEGWRLPDSAWSPERLMGSAVHAGMAARFKGQSPLVEAAAVLFGGWVMGTEHDIDAWSPILEKVLRELDKWCQKVINGHEIVMVEQSLGEDGHTTPDLVTRENGELAVTDWKYSHNVPADRISYRLEGTERSHQFLHYAWAVGNHLNEPVKRVRKVVIVGLPKAMVRHVEVEITQPMLDSWLEGAEAKSDQMDDMRQGGIGVYRREEGCKPFGDKWPCEMMEACWTCHGDREKMKNFYVKGDPNANG